MLGTMLKGKSTLRLYIRVLVSANVFRFKVLNQPDGQGGQSVTVTVIRHCSSQPS